METEHYDTLATRLENHASFDDRVKKWNFDAVIQELELNDHDLLMDVGGGSGFITQMLYKTVENPKFNYVCLDTSEKMIEEAKKLEGIIAEVCSAEEIAVKVDALNLPKKPNKLLFKEVIHHFAASFDTTWKSLYNWLDPGSKIIIFTRAKKSPLLYWEAAMQAWANQTPEVDIPINAIKEAGFDVTINKISLNVPVKKELYYTRLRERCHSHLHSFTDLEIETGLAELDRLHPGDTVPYTDEFFIIKGTK